MLKKGKVVSIRRGTSATALQLTDLENQRAAALKTGMWVENSPDAELHSALEKADQGVRLIEVGDYEGAITVCTEAIESQPGLMLYGPYRTRAEAYTRLGAGHNP